MEQGKAGSDIEYKESVINTEATWISFLLLSPAMLFLLIPFAKFSSPWALLIIYEYADIMI